MKLVLALMLGAAAAFAPHTASRAATSLSVGPVGEQKLTTKGPSSKFSMDNQYAMGHMGKYDDAATEDERSRKFLARHDGDVGAELGSLQVRTPERVAAEIAQLKADRQARVRRAKKLN
jgi:alkanesulfonate monooxygenase SsuD/methylene tetrahydromethanopterin reductase-like flavin-dependent oxidoreductase (luciferase family)